jgi:hypothetical protein
VTVDPVVALVFAYRMVGSLPVLRWPFWGAVLAILVDLFDLLLFNLATVVFGWPGFDGYQTFDKWADQVYLAAFLIVAMRDFPRTARVVAGGLYVLRLVGFAGFEIGLLPREGLFLFPNLFEFWFIAVAFTMRYRPAFEWTPGRSVVALVLLGAGKEVQEWALHVARLFDGVTFLDALDAIRRAILRPFGGG